MKLDDLPTSTRRGASCGTNCLDPHPVRSREYAQSCSHTCGLVGIRSPCLFRVEACGDDLIAGIRVIRVAQDNLEKLTSVPNKNVRKAP